MPFSLFLLTNSLFPGPTPSPTRALRPPQRAEMLSVRRLSVLPVLQLLRVLERTAGASRLLPAGGHRKRHCSHRFWCCIHFTPVCSLFLLDSSLFHFTLPVVSYILLKRRLTFEKLEIDAALEVLRVLTKKRSAELQPYIAFLKGATRDEFPLPLPLRCSKCVCEHESPSTSFRHSGLLGRANGRANPQGVRCVRAARGGGRRGGRPDRQPPNDHHKALGLSDESIQKVPIPFL